VKYCKLARLCVCLCLSFHEDISQTTHLIFTNFFVHIPYGRGSVVLRLGDKIQGKGQFGDFFLIDSALYGPYSGENCARKDRFGLNLLICRKVRQSSISY